MQAVSTHVWARPNADRDGAHLERRAEWIQKKINDKIRQKNRKGNEMENMTHPDILRVEKYGHLYIDEEVDEEWDRYCDEKREELRNDTTD